MEQAAPTSANILRPVDDPLYEMTQQPVPVSKDTVCRVASSITASGNTSGTPASAMNTTGKGRTTFELNQTSGMRYRYGNLGIKMNFIIADEAGTGVIVPGNTATDIPFTVIPPPDLAVALMRYVSLEINSGTPIYTSSNVRAEYKARLFRNYSQDVLENLEEQLMLPIWSTHGRNTYNPRYYKITQLNDTYLSSFYTAVTGLTVTESAASVTTAQMSSILKQPKTYERIIDQASYERGLRYCSGRTNSYGTVITKIIPLRDLFPSIPDSLMTNLRRLKINIDWVESVTSPLTALFTAASSTGATYGVHLLGAELITDAYVLSPSQSAASLQDKLTIQPDILPIMKTQTFSFSYAGSSSDTLIPSIKNLQGLMIFINNIKPDGTYHDNGQTLVTDNSSSCDKIIYGDAFQSGNGSYASAADVFRLNSSDPLVSGQTNAGLTSVQISFQGRTYPESPLELTTSVNSLLTPNWTKAYHEYLKFCNLHGRRDFRVAVPWNVYKSTHPFIALSPFSTEAPKLTTQGNDLIVRLRGGGETVSVSVIIFYNTQYVVSADGVVTEY